MQAFKDAEDSLNAKYKSSIVTEFPFNGLGILEKVTRRDPKLRCFARAATTVNAKTACFVLQQSSH